MEFFEDIVLENPELNMQTDWLFDQTNQNPASSSQTNAKVTSA